MQKLALHDESTSPSSLLDGTPPSEDARAIDPAHLERALYGGARGFLARPGKAFRARLIEAAYALAGGAGSAVPSAAIEAVELLHGGSLIIDDIQDGADERRGGPALHRQIGVPLALNTGNWLYFVALARLDELPLDLPTSRALTREAHQCLVRCHEGQALDLALRVPELRASELSPLVRTTSLLKTGALASFAAQLGGRLAGASARVLEALRSYGQQTGVALQMLDDLGSFVHESRHHKALEDLRGARVGWVWAWAHEVLDELSFKQLVRQLAREADLPLLRARLAEAVEPIGRLRVREALHEAERELVGIRAPTHALDAVRAQLSNLEKSYG